MKKKIGLFFCGLVLSINVSASNDIEVIDYNKYSNYSELIKDIGVKTLNEWNVIPNDVFDNLARIGDTIEDESLRKDVNIFINENYSNNKEKEIMVSFAKTMQELMFLKPNELLRGENIAYLNLNLMSPTMCIYKLYSQEHEQNQLYKKLKTIEVLTLNTELRNEHFQNFQKITEEIIKTRLMADIVMAAYERCFNKEGTQREIIDILNKIENQNK